MLSNCSTAGAPGAAISGCSILKFGLGRNQAGVAVRLLRIQQRSILIAGRKRVT